MDKTTDTIPASSVVAWYAPLDRKGGNPITSRSLRVFCGTESNGRKLIHRVDGHVRYADGVSLSIGRTTLVSDASLDDNYVRVDPPEWSKPEPPAPPAPKPEPTMADVMAKLEEMERRFALLASADARGQLPLIKAS